MKVIKALNCLIFSLSSPCLLGAIDKTGLLVPFLKTYSYGSKSFVEINSSDATATGIFNTGILNLDQYLLEFGNIIGATKTSGINASAKITMTGSTIAINNIQSTQGNAFGASGSNGLYFFLGNSYVFFNKYPSGIVIENIEGHQSAYGLSVNGASTLRGKGEIAIGNITAHTQEAGGVKTNALDIINARLSIKGVKGESKAYGVSMNSISSENTKIFFQSIESSNEAVGLEFGSSSRNSSKSTQITFSSISSKTSNSYGLKNTQGSLSWEFVGDLFEKSTNNVLSFSNISSESGNAFGIYTTQSFTLDSQNSYSKDCFVFENISSKSGYAIGLYAKNSVNLSLQDGASLSFNQLSSTSQSSYGIVADGASVNIKLSNSSLRIGVVGDGGAFASNGGGKINLEMIGGSALYLDGNGGVVSELRVDENALIDLSGAYSGALKNRNTSRTLTINKLANYNYFRNGSMATFGLYVDVDKGIADRVDIKDIYNSYGQGVEFKVFYQPSSKQTLSAKASPYILLAKTASDVYANGMNEFNLVGYSEGKDGFLKVFTTLHRYNQGNEAYYYLDTQERQNYAMDWQDIKGGAEGIISHYGAYFLGLDTLNKRMGDLRGGFDGSGMWGRIDFGGVGLGSGDEQHMMKLELGGDFVRSFEGKNYFMGVNVGYSTALRTPSSIQTSQNFDFGVYGGVFLDNGLFYDVQLGANYFQTTLAESSVMNSVGINQWAMSFCNELGYRFFTDSQRRGFFVEPSASLNFGVFTPLNYTQSSKSDRDLNVEVQPSFLFDSKVGGKIGYGFGNQVRTDLFLGVYYTYKQFFKDKINFTTLVGAENIQVSWSLEDKQISGLSFNVGSKIEILKHSKLYVDLDFGFAERFATMYKLNFSYRFVF